MLTGLSGEVRPVLQGSDFTRRTSPRGVPFHVATEVPFLVAISSMARVGVDWTAHAAVAGALPAHCHAAAHRLSGLPGAVLSDQGVGQHEKLVHGGARRVEPTDLAPVQRPTTER